MDGDWPAIPPRRAGFPQGFQRAVVGGEVVWWTDQTEAPAMASREGRLELRPVGARPEWPRPPVDLVERVRVQPDC